MTQGTFTGRHALVTGAARRIGAAIVLGLADAGFAVTLHASERSKPAAEALAARLAERGVRAGVLSGDLADARHCASVIQDAARRIGPLHLLVNNAAIFQADRADAFEPDLWDRHFATNLRAPALLGRDFAVQATPGADAAIVNIIDQRVLRPTPQYFSYSLAKAALWTATRTMAQAFAERGVRVNAIGPGPVLPNASDGDAGFTKEVDGVPLRRAVAPDEIVAAVLYLAGAPGVTGQMIAVDSGQHLGWRTPDIVE